MPLYNAVTQGKALNLRLLWSKNTRDITLWCNVKHILTTLTTQARLTTVTDRQTFS